MGDEQPQESQPALTVTVRRRRVPLLTPHLKAKHRTEDGQEIEVELTDGFGLMQDPRLYADKDCSNCYGRGVINRRRKMTPADARQRLETGRFRWTEADAGLRDASGKPVFSDKTCAEMAAGKWVDVSSTCGCATLEYERACKAAATLRACQAKENPTTSQKPSEP